MGQLALVSDNDWEHDDFLQKLGIPADYMGDFSVLGVVVDNYQEAISRLEDTGFSISQIGRGSLIRFDDPASVQEIVKVLAADGIGFEYLDIANRFYQA